MRPPLHDANARPPPPPAPKPNGTPLDLVAWGAPPGVAAAYAARRVPRLYPWQAAAVAAGADGSSLLFAAPTGGGKSIVAELLIVRRLLRAAAAAPPGAPRPRAVFVVPYQSVVAEKAAHLAAVLAPGGWTVRGYVAGGPDSARAPLAKGGEDVAVMTGEKLNACLSTLLAARRAGDVACLVVDEFHMVADPGRGAALEVALAKALHWRSVAARQRKEGGSTTTAAGAWVHPPGDPPGAPPAYAHALQIVAMSATMAGLDAACAWLGARLFLTDERPTPLSESAVIGRAVFPLLRGVGLAPHPARVLAPADARDADGLVALVAESVGARAPTLVFCGARALAEATAARLAAALVPPLVPPPDAAQSAARAAAADALATATVDGCSGGVLTTAIRSGVAYHHAGLAAPERGVVEAAFRTGAVLALCCTSTLAAGVNLPAARVVIRGLRQGGPTTLSRSSYLQCVGRAGRAGLAASGDAYVVESPAARSDVAALLTAPLPTLASQLVDAPGASADPPLERLLLETAAARAIATPGDVAALVRCTLAAHAAADAAGVAAAAAGALRALHERGLLRRTETVAPKPTATGVFASSESPPPPPRITWSATPRGAAVAAACLPTAAAEALHDDVAAVLSRPAPLNTPIPLLFAVLPRDAGSTSALRIRSWAAWADALADAPPRLAAAAAAVGVTPAYARARARCGGGDAAVDACHGRLLVAAAVAALLDETPPAAVAARWARVCASAGDAAPPPPGELARLQAVAGQRAAMGAAVADAAGYALGATAIARVADRCAAGVRADLVPLVAALPLLDAARARALADAGLGTVAALARAAPERVARALLAPTRRRGGGRADGDAAAAVTSASVGAAWAAWAAKTADAVKKAARAVLEAEAEAAAAADEVRGTAATSVWGG